MGTSKIAVFISYIHDSGGPRERVLALSERLRADGIETLLDSYVNGAPSQGWPRWMLDQLDAAASVLVVCTETYHRRFRGQEELGHGKGVDWEGALITQEMYASRSRTLKFVRVFLAAAVEDWIPEPLRSQTHYALTTEGAYQSLYDFLLGQAGVEPRPVGALKSKPRRTGAAFRLRALGRLTEALEPMRVVVKRDVEKASWSEAAISYSNLSELELTLGEVTGALGDAEQSVTYADRSGEWGKRLSNSTTHADALHQAGHRAEAEARFREAL